MRTIEQALITAEAFMSGFEDDDMQEGMTEKLEEVRAALRLLQPAPGVVVVDTHAGTMKGQCLSLADLEYPVTLDQQGKDRFRVTYGKQVRSDLNYGAAASELGGCIMHALACAGQLDNRTKGER